MAMRALLVRKLMVVAVSTALVGSFVACGAGEETTADEASSDDAFAPNEGAADGREPNGELPGDPPAIDTGDGGVDDDLDGSMSAGTDAGITDASAAKDSGSKTDSGTTVKDSGVTVKDSGVTAPIDFLKYNLDVVNFYRATKGIAALKLDTQLNTFAQAGSVQLAKDHIPHKHFSSAGTTIFSLGFKTMAAENQGDPNGWPVLNAKDASLNEKAQIDAIQKAMFAEGPGTGAAHGHYTNMMNAKYKRIGVGLYTVAGKLYLTNDFSD